MAAGTLAIAGQERLGVDLQQTVLLIGVDSGPQPAVDVDVRGQQRLGQVRQPGRHNEGNRLDGQGSRRQKPGRKNGRQGQQ